MRKIGISCRAVVDKFGVERGFKLIKESGFDTVDFSLEGYNLKNPIYSGSEDQFQTHFDSIRRAAADAGIEIVQTHGRCVTYKPDDEESIERSDRINELDIKATAALGAPSCVIHFINSTRWGKLPPETYHTVNSEIYSKLIPTLEKYKVNLAMETFGAARISGARIRDFFADPVEFKRQFDTLDTRFKTICVDTGHTHEAESFWVPPPEQMIRILGSDVTLLHLHDNSGHWDDHLLPGLGNINWPAVFEALDDVGFKGSYNFELKLGFAGKMLEDFVRFSGKYLRTFVDSLGNLKS